MNIDAFMTKGQGFNKKKTKERRVGREQTATKKRAWEKQSARKNI